MAKCMIVKFSEIQKAGRWDPTHFLGLNPDYVREKIRIAEVQEKRIQTRLANLREDLRKALEREEELRAKGRLLT